jgi:hypothetical protein
MARQGIKVFPHGDRFLVSDQQVWVEGAYASEEAARLAPRLDPDMLADAWERRRPEPLTMDDLRPIKAAMKSKGSKRDG